MVEMEETANILHNASSQSLVLMDEVGRGTSTFDGLSLAWSCGVELATRIRAFTLFATHYFELTTLPDEHPGIANVHLDAAEHGEGIVFLHALREGPANQSYGLQVAALAACQPRSSSGPGAGYGNWRRPPGAIATAARPNSPCSPWNRPIRPWTPCATWTPTASPPGRPWKAFIGSKSSPARAKPGGITSTLSGTVPVSP
jgi:hypothetical protein